MAKFVGGLFVAGALCLVAMSPPAHAGEVTAELEGLEEQAYKQAAALASPSVVRIETVGGLDRIGQVLAGTGPTTGVVVSADGYIISSAFNFASKPSSILVSLLDGRRLPAEQVATDRAKMLTLLKVEATDLIPAQAAPRESFRVGQWAIALGRTFDAEFPSVSVGIVSALNRVWGKAIQTDAKISPVNYGGPLVDIQGRTLGILVPLSPQSNGEIAGIEWYDSGIGFAIPLADVYASLDRLKTGKDLLPGLLGITFKGQNQFNEVPLIDRVRYGSPGQQAGWKPGDAIVEVDGQKIVRQAQVRQVLGNKYADDKVTIAVKRGEETFSKELTLVAELIPYESSFLGILPERAATGAEAAPGVGIRLVYPESPAAAAGLEAGQRILKFNELEAASAATLTDLVSRVRPGEKARLVVRSGETEREVEVTLKALPENVPAELQRLFIPPVEAKGKGDSFPKTGRLSETLAAHEHEYWAYVPEDYNPAHKYALLVWLHPAGDTMEAAMMKIWKPICDERGIILLAPKAKKLSGWEPPEAEFVKDLTTQFSEQYSVDRSRVLVHGFASGCPLAYLLSFKYREQFKGVAAAAFPLPQMPPDNEPDFRLQFYLVCGDKDPVYKGVQASAAVLGRLKYPVSFRTLKGGEHKYPQPGEIEELARWIDALDRI